MKKLIPLSAALLLCLSLTATPAAQRREHLTPEEIEHVRDNQALDKRTSVFIRAAERRALMLTDPAAASRNAEKEKESWGEVTGTRAQLLYDVARILDEAVTNIDDVSMRDPSSGLLRKSLYHLSQAASRLLPQLAPLREQVQEKAERDQLERALETAQEIIEAAKSHAVTEADTKVKDKGGKKGN
jgi:hypothetical protein